MPLATPSSCIEIDVLFSFQNIFNIVFSTDTANLIDIFFWQRLFIDRLIAKPDAGSVHQNKSVKAKYKEQSAASSEQSKSHKFY